MDKKPKIIVITGPTSSGKSDVAIRLAKEFDGEIVSADSRQVYRDMNLGTGKVPVSKVKDHPSTDKAGKSKAKSKSKKFTPSYSEGIAHYLIDIVSPRTEYNVSKFKKDAEKVIWDILSRGKTPIICGGTGFWIKSVTDNITFPEVKPNWELRNKLRNKTSEELFERLKDLDQKRARVVDRKNKVRLIRAIEICNKLGKVPSLKTKKLNFNTLLIGIDCSKEALEKKIQRRLNRRFLGGMIDEVEMLRKKYSLSWKKIQSFGLAYFWIPLFLQKKIDEKELRERLFLAERNYAKRQRTWLKKEEGVVWLKNYGEIKKEVKVFSKDCSHKKPT